MWTNSNDQHSPFLAEFRTHLESLEKSGRANAKALDEDRNIYHVWSVLDALASAYSLDKYGEKLSADNASVVHEAMQNPGAIVGITLESLFLVSVAFLSSWYDKKDNNNERIQFLVELAPILREIIKGLKNAMNGGRAACTAFSNLGIDIRYLINPLGIALGILAAIDRALLLKMKEARKAKMTHNLDLIKRLKKLTTLSDEEKEEITKEIALQKNWVLVAGYLGVSVNGLIDGLYLYAGALTLTPLAPTLLAPMLILCAVYTAACVATRFYENYDFELKLKITQTQTNLLLISRELFTVYKKLGLEKARANDTALDLSLEELQQVINSLESNIYDLIDQFEVMRRLLITQSTHSYLTTSLAGLKTALNSYSALTSIMFLVSTLLILNGATFPAWLLVTSVSLGLALIIGFVAHSIRKKYQQVNQMDTSDELFCSEQLKNQIKSNLAHEKSLQEKIDLGLDVAPPEVNLAPEWFETVRASTSGFGKGERFVEFVGLQEQVIAGHEVHNQSPVILLIDAICAILFGIVMGLKAAAKGLRDPLGKINLVDKQTAPVTTPPKPVKQAAPMPTPDIDTEVRPINKHQKDIITSEPEIEVTPLPHQTSDLIKPNKLPKFKRMPSPILLAAKEQPLERRLCSYYNVTAEELANIKLGNNNYLEVPASAPIPFDPIDTLELDPVDTLGLDPVDTFVDLPSPPPINTQPARLGLFSLTFKSQKPASFFQPSPSCKRILVEKPDTIPMNLLYNR